MPSPGNQFLSDEFGDIEDYFVTDYQLIDQYVGDQLWLWSENTGGQLGDNTTTFRSTPITTLLGGTNWKFISNGNNHTIAIKTDGTLWAWGQNNVGQLGINDTTNRSTPVTTLLGGTNWKSVDGGGQHVSAIKTDGTLWVWGRNLEGQLGINDNTARNTPVTTRLGGTNWKTVVCANDTVAAIKTDGTLWLWGQNGNGQLGDNTTTIRSTPVTTFAGGTNWKSVSGLVNHTVALKTDGTLWAWGYNSYGQLGINIGGTTTGRTTPVTTFVGGTNWKSVAGGSFNTVAIKTDGTLWVCGRNFNGNLGINSLISKSTPVTTFAGGTNWKQVTSGYEATLAIKTDGTLWSWGRNAYGNLGVNDNTQRNTPVTTRLGGTNWKKVSLKGQTAAAITAGLNVDF